MKAKLAQIRMAETTVPWAAAIVGGALLVLGAALLAVRRRSAGLGSRADAAPTEPAEDAPSSAEVDGPERTPVSV